MRLLNAVLWVGLVLLLGCCVNLDAQYNSLTALRPAETINSSVDNSPIPNGAQLVYNATAGNCVIGVMGWANNPATDVVIKDNAGNTLNISASFSAGTGHREELFWETVPSTGTFWVQSQVNFAGLGEQTGVSMAEFSSTTTTCTPDGTQSTSVGTGGSSRSASVTTTDNGELVVGGATASSGNTFILAPIWPAYFGAWSSTIGTSLTFRNCGAAGACSVGNNLNIAGGTNNAIAVLAFLPPTQAISTSALPDCAKSVAYAATLTDIGGTGSPTWTVTVGSLPTGLSLSAGGAITGTCTGTGVSSFTVSDGVATKALSITAQASFSPVSIGPVGLGGGTCPGGPLGDCTTSFSASSGHMGLLILFGFDSSTNGYIALNNVQDTLGCGDVWTRVEGLPGITQGPIQLYTTTFKCSGSAQIGIVLGSFAGTPLDEWAADITGQAVMDAGVGVTDTVGSNITTGNFTAQVPNELLIAVGIYNRCASQTLAINSPFTAIYTPGCNIVDSSMVVATQPVTTATTYTVTDTLSGAASGPAAEALGLWGIRPGFALAATFAGEKPPRRVY